MDESSEAPANKRRKLDSIQQSANNASTSKEPDITNGRNEENLEERTENGHDTCEVESNTNTEVKNGKEQPTNNGTHLQEDGASTSKGQTSKPQLQPSKKWKTESQANTKKFIYGNYSQYYGYRNNNATTGFHDKRLDLFESHRELFDGKEVLDIGCNNGFLTMEIAKKLPIRHITGLDIDAHLISQANRKLCKEKKKLILDHSKQEQHKFPYNVNFIHGNYVLRDDVLLKIEKPQFDVILCLSLTKWIHLNFGDVGLKQAFRRMFLQLRCGGKLILEAQPYNNYKRRKNLTEAIAANYKAIKFLPSQFSDYLLSTECGFESVVLIGLPEHDRPGFQRPVQLFTKA